MPFVESIRIALSALRANKMRSFLTLLGIVIGVMTVIGMMTIIEGINASVKRELATVGTNTFYVRKYPAMMTGNTREKYRNRKDVTPAQAEAISERASLVQLVTPELYTFNERVRYGKEKTNSDVTVIGGAEAWQRVNSRYVDSGRFLQKMEIQSGRRVCVIGMDIVETLFPFSDPVGKEVRIGAHKFKVIGTLEEKGASFGQSEDNRVVIPYTTFQRVFGEGLIVQIAMQSNAPELLPASIDEVVGILRVERKVPPGKPNDFEVLTQDSLMEIWENLTGVVFAAAIGIAAISLLVGGIGIMNIMLVSVTERTREIGVRKSLGAKRRDILRQFIIEAIVLALFGGVIGIAAGLGLGSLIGSLSPLPASVPVWAIFGGLLFSSGVGLFFGIYPAGKAAKLDPIEALRYE